jgi:hypothetical protein
MLLKLTLSGLHSPALLHSFTIPENSEPSRLLEESRSLRLFEPPVIRSARKRKQRPVRKPADVVALSPSIRVEIDPSRKGDAKVPNYFGYHSSNRTSIPVPSNRFWNTLKSEPR